MVSGKNKMIRSIFFITLLIHATVAQKGAGPPGGKGPQIPAAVPAQKWSTLSGNQPIVIARGGYSGVFPEFSDLALSLAMDMVPNAVTLCNIQFSKDGMPFCLTDINLQNATTIGDLDPKAKPNTYNVNGKEVTGFFAVDYPGDVLLNNVGTIQAILSRTFDFDGYSGIFPASALKEAKLGGIWLNVQYDAFYAQHGVNPLDAVLQIVRTRPVDFISCPEIGFMKSINGKVNAPTKLVFQFLNANDVEPTTRQPYGTILKDLATIKSFASGIMVPKEYIWPVKPDNYLGAPTTLVADAHKLGLEVYASGFANDFFASYNYSYDPSAEYLQFVDKGDSVDGVVTDFPSTPQAAMSCFAHNNTKPQKGPALVISKNGASGVYPGSTDLAYEQAINDGADIIDCSVQMTKDGVAFCLDSADLIGDTTAMTMFMSRSSSVPEIQPKNGIFSFDLTWSEIQTLKPQIVSPYLDGSQGFQRNPAEKNSGKFVTLSDFLELAKAKAVTGILIHIENAAYLASKKSLDIVGAVSAALSNATFDKQSTQEVLIESDDSSVLSKFEDIPSYKTVFYVKDKISDAPKQSADEIKKYADAVNIGKSSATRSDTRGFEIAQTKVVQELKDANLTVYIHLLRNEYLSQRIDYFADPNLEIATYVHTFKADGIVTEFPATASRYMKSPCSDDPNASSIKPVVIGGLRSSINPKALPPADAPLPTLEIADVVDPPLPEVTKPSTAPPAGPAGPATSRPSGGMVHVANLGVSLAAILLLAMLSAGPNH